LASARVVRITGRKALRNGGSDGVTSARSMRLVYMGTAAFAVPSLCTLVRGPHEVAAVYTQPARPAGRGLKARLSPVQVAAMDLGLAVRTPATLKNPIERHVLADVRPDLVVVAAYGLILP
jgi:methionyl-tRNA formyltransferase